MTIGQVAIAAGVSTPTIRFYEASGLLPAPPRKNGIRTYDPATVERVRVLRFYRSAGVSIDDLATMFGDREPKAKLRSQHDVVRLRMAEIDRLIDEARAMKRRLRKLLGCRCGGDRKQCVIFKEA
jgi:MerR family copper efflux transcriptional regulator